MNLKVSVLLCVLLWSAVEVHSQSAPYVSFMGETLPNHSYVDLTLVGDDSYGDPGNTVRCHTDLDSCCTSVQGPHVHRGDWYFPNGTRLPFSGYYGYNIYEARGPQRVDLRRRYNSNSPSGIYRCDISTNTIHHDYDLSMRDTVYVGLYATGGNTILHIHCS